MCKLHDFLSSLEALRKPALLSIAQSCNIPLILQYLLTLFRISFPTTLPLGVVHLHTLHTVLISIKITLIKKIYIIIMRFW